MGVTEGDRYNPLVFPDGAGCDIWEIWPDPYGFRTNGANANLASFTKSGGAGTPGLGGGFILTYNANANRGYNAALQGRAGATIGATVAGAPNGMQYSAQGWRSHFARRAIVGSKSLRAFDRLGAFSVSMIALFTNPAAALAANIDNGLQWNTAGNVTLDDGQSLRLGTPGIGIRCGGPQTIEVHTRGSQGGAVTFTNVTPPAPFDVAKWNHYEIRIIAASGETEALAKWYINGNLVFQKSWDAANSMPETNANVAGLKVDIVSNGGLTNAGFTVHQAIYRGAINEANLSVP